MRRKVLLSLLIAIGISTSAQVGINTATPTTTLEIKGKTPADKVEGLLIPRFTGDEIFNMPISVAQGYAAASSSNEANLVYATTAASLANQDKAGRGEFLTTHGFFYWDNDAQKWMRLFVATSSAAGNDGVVKVNSGGTQETKPSLTLNGAGNTYGPMTQLIYSTPLNFALPPTTSWPENTIPFPGVTSNIYIGDTPTTQRWRENNIMGQVHIWRVIATVTAGSNSSGSVMATMKNPDSQFEINSVGFIPSGTSGLPKVLTFYFYTVADEASLALDKGYQIFFQADISAILVIESVTRISLFKD